MRCSDVYKNYLMQVSEDVGYNGRHIVEPTDGWNPEQYCSNAGEVMRLWLMQDWQSYNWQLTSEADTWLQAIPEIM